MQRGFRNVSPPVKEGDEMSVKIEAVGEKGDGIAKVNNFVVFVPNTKQGDLVKVKITKVLRNMAFAEVIGEAASEDLGSNDSLENSSEDSSDESYSDDESSEMPEDSEDF